MKIEPKATRRGVTMVEVLVITAILALFYVAVLVPYLAKSRARSCRINCVNNVKQIGLSFKLWAGDNGDRFPMQTPVNEGGAMELVNSGVAYVHFQVMSNELSTPRILICPGDTTRTNATSFHTNFSDRNVSYFVGVDASPGSPTTILVGDANLGIGGVPFKPGLVALWTNDPVKWTKPRPNHGNGGGSICLADASTQEPNDAQLRQLLQQTGAATNRLAMP